jgi:hypothetical protein
LHGQKRWLFVSLTLKMLILQRELLQPVFFRTGTGAQPASEHMWRRTNYLKLGTNGKSLSSSSSYFPNHLHLVPRRSQGPLFFGKLSADSFEIPQEILKMTDQAFCSADHQKFVAASFTLMRHLENLDDNHPLWLNSDLMFNGKSSNLHSSFESIFRMSLLKTVSVITPKVSCSSNYSGHFFVGSRGIGKSVMMQTCCLVVGQLLPQAATIYLDASVHRNDPLRLSLIHLLNERSGGGPYPVLPLDVRIEIVLARAAQLNCSLVLFIDEAQALYRNETDWSDLMACITGFRCAVFLSGSDNLLTPCVKLTQQDKEFLNTALGLEPHFRHHETLNTTKLTQKSVRGFTTPEQYLHFFQSRQNLLPTLCPGLASVGELPSLKSKVFMDEITSLHNLTAGRLRAMHALREGGAEYSELLDFDPLSITSEENGYLQPFFDIIAQRGAFNPFDLPRLAIASQLPQKIAYHLLQRKLITYVSAGVVTLASPAIYLVCQRRPSVFISHAESDKEQVLGMVEMLKGIATVVCSSDQDTRPHLSKVDSQAHWEANQIKNIGQNGHYAVVVLSSTYCDKVEKGEDCGAAREWKLITELPVPIQSSVIYAYIGKNSENVRGLVKNHLGDKPLLRFASSDSKAFFDRLMEPSNVEKP